MSERPARDRRVRAIGWFLAISYGLGAPLTALLEARGGLISRRFDLPPELIYLVCGVQLVCAVALLERKAAPWAAAVLSAITLGAIASHLRIRSPLTALPALLFTALQVWFALASRSAPPRLH